MIFSTEWIKIKTKIAKCLPVIFIFAASGWAQTSLPNSMHAAFITEKISLDAQLIEPAWRVAEHISNFTQRELNEGFPSTERTEVAILYDRQNLYIGVWCYDSQPDKILAQKMQRDFAWGSEDNFEVIIDTYHDRRNGYLFVTNPNGALADALIQNNGRSFNDSWDGVWEVAATITKEGWFAEFALPFSTLKFANAEEQIWGINFERNIRRKHEQVMWQGWSRDSELEMVNRAGCLLGIRGVNSVNLMEFKPYLTGGVEQSNPNGSMKGMRNIGGDLNYLITPTVKLNATLNTDFAQAEADREQINLTRFSLYYPEKREFFLEGQDYFDFSLGERIIPFYSRRIGLSPDRKQIPVLGGLRILGKSGRTTFGGMSLQTAVKDRNPSTNYTILRMRQDVLRQSSIGIIGAGKIEPDRQNWTYGADFLYSTSSFLKNKNLSFGGAFASSYTSDKLSKSGMAHRIFISMPNDLIEFDASWYRAGRGFNPEVGYLRRENFQHFYGELQINTRPRFIPWLKFLVFKPLDIDLDIDDITKKLQTLGTEFRPLGFQTKSGEFFEFNIQRSADHPIVDFTIIDGIVIPPKEYWYTHYEIQFETFSGRPWSAGVSVNWGEFYNGNRTVWEATAGWKVNKHLMLTADYLRNDISLPAGSFTVNEVGGRIDFALSPSLFGSLFGQWNNEDQEMLLNFRINWIPKPGTDLFFIIDQGVDTRFESFRRTKSTVLSKFVWRFVI